MDTPKKMEPWPLSFTLFWSALNISSDTSVIYWSTDKL